MRGILKKYLDDNTINKIESLKNIRDIYDVLSNKIDKKNLIRVFVIIGLIRNDEPFLYYNFAYNLSKTLVNDYKSFFSKICDYVIKDISMSTYILECGICVNIDNSILNQKKYIDTLNNNLEILFSSTFQCNDGITAINVYNFVNPLDTYFRDINNDEDHISTAIAEDGVISFYDGYEPKLDTLFHEYAHILDKINGNISSTSEWIKLMNEDSEYISKYAMTNREEDFAESFMNYYLNNDEMREKCPNRSEFIGKCFNNLEINKKSI